jgi:hypothetical protein
MPKSSSINQLILILMAVVLGQNKFFMGMKIYQKLRIVAHSRKNPNHEKCLKPSNHHAYSRFIIFHGGHE